jgi:hypothetical protein
VFQDDSSSDLESVSDDQPPEVMQTQEIWEPDGVDAPELTSKILRSKPSGLICNGRWCRIKHQFWSGAPARLIDSRDLKFNSMPFSISANIVSMVHGSYYPKGLPSTLSV